MQTRFTLLLFFLVFFLVGANSASAEIPLFGYRVLNVFDHDPEAYTQGLVLDGKTLYEGTGLHGKSTLRKVALHTGKVLKQRKLPADHFGEGITVVGDRIIQLTWQSRKGFVYDKKTFKLLQEFDYQTEGWGITFDGRHLIMSDGSAFLQYLNPKTFKPVRLVAVMEKDRLVSNLNELEYAEGEIYANIWGRDVIACISPQTGAVRGWIDLSGLRRMLGSRHRAEVLNGIAFDPERKTFLVTGKHWPKLFEIRIIKPFQSQSRATRDGIEVKDGRGADKFLPLKFASETSNYFR